MDRNYAFVLLGEHRPSIARMLGISASAVYKWPEKLPQSISDKVIAARTRLEWHLLKRTYPDAKLPPLILEILADVPADAFDDMVYADELADQQRTPKPVAYAGT